MFTEKNNVRNLTTFLAVKKKIVKKIVVLNKIYNNLEQYHKYL